MSKATLPWIEKYRPKTLEDIIGHKEKIETLQGLVNKNEMTHLLFYGPPSCSKCLYKGTKVRMADGSIKLVEDIVPNDQLMGDQSDPRTVLSVCQGVDQLYKIKQDHGIEYIVNTPHILTLTLCKSGQVRWKEQKQAYEVDWFEHHQHRLQTFSDQSKELAKEAADRFFLAIQQKPTYNYLGDVIDIPLKDYLRKSIAWRDAYRGYRVAVDFPEQPIIVDPYVMGLWLSDENASSNTLTILRNENNQSLLNYLKIYAKESQITFEPSVNDPLAFTIQSIPKATKQSPFEMAMETYTFSAEECIPHAYLRNCRIIRLCVLAGIIDQLGTFHGSTYQVGHRSEILINDIVNLGQSLGYYCRKSVDINACRYRVDISSNDFSDLPTQTISNQAKGKTNYQLSKLTIEKWEKGPYYGFELDGNGRFLLEDYTVTHNTSTILALAQEMYGDQYKKYILELNASDDRGIDIVRKKIPDFVRTTSNKIRLVILDEADAMTTDAQMALRRVIEKYSKNSRFCLICNNINKIISGLQSRCSKMRFGYLDPQEIKAKVRTIIETENVHVTDEGLETLITINRDFRQILNTLQCLHAIKSANQTDYEPITANEINIYLGVPTQEQINDLLNILFDHSFDQACQEVINLFKDNQWTPPDLVRRLAEWVVTATDLSENQKYFLIDRLSDIEIKLSHSNDAEVQLYALVSAFQQSKNQSDLESQQ